MVDRIIKFSLHDAEGKAINPVSAFARFGCSPHGLKSLISNIRLLFAAAIGVDQWIDFGISDVRSHASRAPMDGDPVWFWLRPQDLLHSACVVMLLLMVGSAEIKRVDTETETRYPRVFLAIWNMIILILPLSASSLILYYQFLRYNSSYDQAYEAALCMVFAYSCLELCWGGWPASPIDVVFPMFAACAFLLYTQLRSRFGVDLYVQLDWQNDPHTAAVNSIVFLFVVLCCSSAVTILAMLRNRWLHKRRGYTQVVETVPLRGLP